MSNIYFKIFFLVAVIFSSERHWAEAATFHNDASLGAVAGESSGSQVDDLSLVSRILKSYNLSIDKKENRGNSMWQTIYEERHRKIHKIFRKEKVEESADILRNPGKTDLFYGIDSLGNFVLEKFRENPYAMASDAIVCLDGLIRFAESIGAIPLDNPESHRDSPVAWSANAIIEQIEQALGQSLTFPNPYPKEFGVLTTKGIVSYRVPQALYQAYRIKQLVKDIPNPKILEIGAGVGRTAYYARELGIKNYTIVDLPFTSVLSGYFLGRTLGEDCVLFSGEPTANSENLVKFLTPSEFLNGTQTYDLIVNVDSMTEMDPEIARAYLHKIQTSTNVYLSINHESNPFTVKQLIAESAQGAHAIRYPYWMRNGYVEEVVWFHPAK